MGIGPFVLVYGSHVHVCGQPHTDTHEQVFVKMSLRSSRTIEVKCYTVINVNWGVIRCKDGTPNTDMETVQIIWLRNL